MAAHPNRLNAGSPYPLGATWDGLGTNFAVFSAHAERVELCLFDPSGRREIARLDLPECTDEVWHGYLPNARTGQIYGYRAHGPYQPQDGHRFNPYKLLLDPYARRLSGTLRWTDALFGYRVNSPRGDLSFDRRDSAPSMPKAVVTDDVFDWGDDRPPNTQWSKTIIYETHLRGMTMRRHEIRANERGTFAALADPDVIKHLRSLGVTAVELMPIHAFVHDRQLIERGLKNYWGYNSFGFFVIQPAYLSDGSRNEMRVAVRRLHAAGIEVILDVVYNHTAEGSEMGPTLSFRGLDNASYYRLVPDNRRHCINDTGTGNTLNLSHPRVLQMVMDSLRYWATSFHVDGFRFDLATTLGREPLGFDTGAGFFDALMQDTELASLKLIAEPWDVGPGGYQLGHFPSGFAEWNDRFRDGLRRYWRGDPGMRPDVAARMSGSGDIFDTRARRPWSSINYIASHDGMTLNDLVSYASKHNEANGEDNHDGNGDEHSANWGAEGESDDPDIRERRRRLQRSMLTSVLTALGTPMVLSGDEYGRTQKGNNNAYCQDNETSWFAWNLARSEEGEAQCRFFSRLTKIRAAYPTLRCRSFLSGNNEIAPGVTDLSWWDERGVPLAPEDWVNHEGRILILRRACRIGEDQVEITAVMLNADHKTLNFKLPGNFRWRLLVDSGEPDKGAHEIERDTYVLAGHGAAVIAARFKTDD